MKPITDPELAQFQRFIFEKAGITMSAQKKALVMGRLARRLEFHALETFSQYFHLLTSGQHADEVQIAIDLLTTNETYFFREMKHFDFLREKALAARGRSESFRVWSAASSSGEEAYSLAMVLADCLETSPWEVLGTDISTRVLQSAAQALYPMERGRHISQAYLRRFCLKGSGEHEGKFLVERNLRNRVQFRQLNLNVPLPSIGHFDMIFLRNVMIYFSDDTKREVVERVITALKPDGYLCIGHSESLHKITESVQQVAPSIFRKVH